jgi:lipopolysaccharide heptosyltransferase II
MSSPQKILVRSPNWIGDQILAFPFFYYLRKAYPQAHITVACVPWVQSIQFRNFIDDIIVLPKALEPTFLSRWDALEIGARFLRQDGPWDLGITLPNSLSSAWLLKRAKVRARRGYGSDGRSFLLSERVSWKKGKTLHRSEAYVQLLPPSAIPRQSVLGFWGTLPENELDAGEPGVLDRFDAEKAWPEAEPLEPPSEPYWVLAPGATAESRRWPVDRFAAFAQKVVQETGWKGIIVGGPSEVDVASRLASDPSLQLRDWTAKGTVTSYWKVFQNARFSLCNDSGLAHVASLCGSFVQVVWGAGNPNRTEPLGPGKVQVSLNPVECWPCEQNTCSQPPGQKLLCLRGIEPEQVWKETKAGIRLKSER